MHGGKKHEGDARSGGIRGAVINSLQTTGLFSKYVNSGKSDLLVHVHTRVPCCDGSCLAACEHLYPTCPQDLGA